MSLVKIRQFVTYTVVRLFVCVAQSLRIETCERLAEVLASLARLTRIRRATIEENLRAAFPRLSERERDRLAWRMWRSLFLLVAEIAHAPRKIHRSNWREHVRISGGDVLTRAFLSDRPLLLVTAHFGNFELGGYVMGLFGFPTSSVARTLDNPFLDRFLGQFRGATGQSIIPKKGGFEQINRVLDQGGALAFLADQYAGSKGLWVDFFGRPASAHKGVALLALDRQVPLAVVSVTRLDRPLSYELRLEAMVDPRLDEPAARGVRELTQWYTRVMERMIARSPEQYWWLHRRWKDHRPARRKSTATAA